MRNLQKKSVLDQGARDIWPRLKVRLNLSELNSGSSMHPDSTQNMREDRFLLFLKKVKSQKFTVKMEMYYL